MVVGFLVFRFFALAQQEERCVVRTVVGFPTAFSGDSGPALSAQLYDPRGVALDSAGNIYVADQGNHRIRKIALDGVITTVAGRGTAGFSGDGGPATSALNEAAGLAFDTGGYLHIADTGNHRIRKIDENGIIQTIAGDCEVDYYSLRCFGGDGGPATQARLYRPMGIAFDGSGNLYIADTGNERVRRVNTNGVIETVAGNGETGVRGDGGPATLASLNSPTAVALDAAGSLLIGNRFGNIQKVSTAGVISTLVLRVAFALAVDAAGNAYFTSLSLDRLFKVTPSGSVTVIAGTARAGFAGDGGDALRARLSAPAALAVDRNGNLFVSDRGNQRIRRLRGGVITTGRRNWSLRF
ncbi:MAG: hypothetical protein ACREUU_19005 [Gammaproteobacteria bacterium]